METKEKQQVRVTTLDGQECLHVNSGRILRYIIGNRAAFYTHQAMPLPLATDELSCDAFSLYDVKKSNILFYPSAINAYLAPTGLSCSPGSNFRTKAKLYKKEDTTLIDHFESSSDHIQIDASSVVYRQVMKVYKLDIIDKDHDAAIAEISQFVYSTLLDGQTATIKDFFQLFQFHPFSIDALGMLISVTKPYRDTFSIERKVLLDRFKNMILAENWTPKQIENILLSIA